MPSSKGSSQPRDQTHTSCGSCIAGRFFMAEPPGKPKNLTVISGKMLTEDLRPVTTACILLELTRGPRLLQSQHKSPLPNS